MIVVKPQKLSFELLAAVLRLQQPDARDMAHPVGIILRPGQRAVDAGRADFKPVFAFYRVRLVQQVRQAAADRLAIGALELTGEIGRASRRARGWQYV